MNILVTGSNGFIGQNLILWLQRLPDVQVLGFDQQHTPQDLAERLAAADLVYHLAGVNRPQEVAEFQTGNVDLTAQLCDLLLRQGKATPVVLASSIQATLDNPYGVSKREAEAVLARYATASGAPALIYRLPNVFGKWCRPNYNSVVATFCHNIAHDLPITISDPARVLELVHIDDVVAHFGAELTAPHPPGVTQRSVAPVFSVTLGALAEQLHAFRQLRQTLRLPDMADPFTRKLYGAFLSYLDEGDFAYAMDKKCDPRGCLAEFIKGPAFGQIFISRTLPGITRGNHYHDTKTEKFLVVEGEAMIRFRHVLRDEVLEYRVSGQDFRVVDIPPGYTHSIENIGQGELVTIFWASEVFNPEHPDTIGATVLSPRF